MTDTKIVQESIDRLQAMRAEIERRLQAAKAVEAAKQTEAAKHAATKNGK